jgi:GTP-sensing pleiotropic transcriptional regulator CodY
MHPKKLTKCIHYSIVKVMEQKHINYVFSAEKNAHLKTERGVSFDEVIAAIQNEQVLDIFKHPNKKRYPNQELMIVNLKGYAYIVPYLGGGSTHEK